MVQNLRLCVTNGTYFLCCFLHITYVKVSIILTTSTGYVVYVDLYNLYDVLHLIVLHPA
jgi:hypothetical protein